VDKKASYHFAKLSLFNVKLLADLEKARESKPAVEEIIHACALNNNVCEPVNLVHQSTLFAHAYIILVWLDQRIRKEFTLSDEESFAKSFSSRFDPLKDTKTRKSEKRKLENQGVFLRTMRNALAHAHVDIEDDDINCPCFVFRDQDKNGGDKAEIHMTWCQLGKLLDATMFAYKDVLYAGR